MELAKRKINLTNLDLTKALRCALDFAFAKDSIDTTTGPVLSPIPRKLRGSS